MGGIVKSRAKLLGLLLLLPLGPIAPSALHAEEDAARPPEQIALEGGTDASGVAAQSGSMMGNVIFDHEEHADEMEIDCDECHHETNAAPLHYPHEQYFHDLWIDCNTCHREDGSADTGPRSCFDCHQAKRNGIADEHLSPKVILHETCWTCHEVGHGAKASESCQLCHTGPNKIAEASR